MTESSPTPLESLTKRTYRTDERYWRDYAESLVPKGDGPTKPDHVARYGVRLFDGEYWIRHFIDKPNGSVSTLCGLPCEFRPNENQDVWKTCATCSAELGRLRSR